MHKTFSAGAGALRAGKAPSATDAFKSQYIFPAGILDRSVSGLTFRDCQIHHINMKLTYIISVALSGAAVLAQASVTDCPGAIALMPTCAVSCTGFFHREILTISVPLCLERRRQHQL